MRAIPSQIKVMIEPPKKQAGIITIGFAVFITPRMICGTAIPTKEIGPANAVTVADKMLDKRIKIQPVFCSIDMEESLNRMKNRTYAQQARYSFSKGISVLEKAMKHKAHNLEEISSVFPDPITIDMTVSVDENVGILLSIIRDRINTIK